MARKYCAQIQSAVPVQTVAQLHRTSGIKRVLLSFMHLNDSKFSSSPALKAYL